MIKVPLLIVSFFAGFWNVIRDVNGSIRHNICVFILGFSFCFGSAIVAEYYGFSSEVSAFLGYMCGILSNQIYDALSRIVKHTPEVVERKLEGHKND